MSTLTRTVVHEADCPKIQSPYVLSAKRIDVRAADQYALPCRRCLPDGLAVRDVVQVEERIAVHPYRPGKVTPPGARRPLCADCRKPAIDHPRKDPT